MSDRPTLLQGHPRALLAVSVALVVAGIVAIGFVSRESGLDRARALVADKSRFAAASTAGEALNEASVHLLDHAERCRSNCDRFFTAAAITRTTGVAALRCTRPDLFAVRNALEAYLDALADGESTDPPFPPAC
jgi:hypothetical protein